MFQHDFSAFDLRSSTRAHRSAGAPLPLWLQGWRALRFAAGAVVKAAGKAAQGLARRRREAATVRELSALRDRELRDIGIERFQIRAIAKSMAHNEEDPRRQSRELQPPQRKMNLVHDRGPLQPCCS